MIKENVIKLDRTPCARCGRPAARIENGEALCERCHFELQSYPAQKRAYERDYHTADRRG